MSKLNDRELSLKVARIMGITAIAHTQVCQAFMANGDTCDCGGYLCFDHTTDDALGKMCVWLAKNHGYTGIMYLKEYYNDLGEKMASDNPHRAIAEAIVETKGGET